MLNESGKQVILVNDSRPTFSNPEVQSDAVLTSIAVEV